MFIRFYKHIALLLLILLSGTLLAETAIAMHGLSQISNNPAQTTKATKYCASGFLMTNEITSADIPLVNKTDQEDSQETGTMVTGNCQSSLQMLESEIFTPFVPENNITYNQFVFLFPNQSFVFEIADPPRL